MITSKEREEVINGAIVGGVLFGALGAGELGGQLSELQCAELEEKARRRLRHKRESAVNHLVEVAQKYGINPKVLEEALLDR